MILPGLMGIVTNHNRHIYSEYTGMGKLGVFLPQISSDCLAHSASMRTNLQCGHPQLLYVCCFVNPMNTIVIHCYTYHKPWITMVSLELIHQLQ